MKTLLLGAAGAAVIAIAPATAQPAPPPTAEAPKIELRTDVRTDIPRMRMPQTREQVVAHVHELFARFDTNHDGFITQQELAAAHQNMMFRVRDRMDGDMATHHEWAVMHDGPIPDRGAAFDRLDANHDGVITRDEFVNARPQMFKREFRIMEKHPAGLDGHAAMMKHRGGGMMMEHMFAMADANHDGRLSIDEATAAALHHFDMADANHDGRLSPDEHMKTRRIMLDHLAK